MTFSWELMQKACELELSLKCGMKMLSHLSLEKWGSLELLLQWSKYQLVISSQIQDFVFYPVFVLRGRERRRKHLNKICVSAKQIRDHLLCNFRYWHAFGVSCLLFWPSDYYQSYSSFIYHRKTEKMVNKPHKSTFLSKGICCFGCYCLPLKQDKPKLCCICAHPHCHEEKMFWENSAFSFQFIRPWSVWAITSILQQL